MKYTCVVVDDEPLAAELIETYVSKIPQLELIGTCANAIEAYEILKTKTVDLLFLDIQMPNITGVDFLRSISAPPKVILTTAYREYAIESYELYVVDYLLKPIPFNRFLKATDKFLKQVITNRLSTESEKGTNNERGYLFVNVNKKHHKLNYDEILYIDSLKDYIQIHTIERSFITKKRISEFETLLPSHFLRIHRSYIVNVEKITAYTQHDIEIGNIEVPIGVTYKDHVISFLKLEPQ